MIREGGISSKTTGPDGAVLDRTELISSLEKQMERKKTIGILEGRHRKKGGLVRGDSILEEDEEDDTIEEGDRTIRQIPLSGEVSRRAISSTARRRGTRTNGAGNGNPGANGTLGRSSQFMDAGDERELAHMEENLAKGMDMVVSFQLHVSNGLVSDLLHCKVSS
jgi:cytokinesis protein